MKTIKCINNNGISAVFSYDRDADFFLVSLEGVYSVKNTINTSQNATTDGSSYAGESLEQRNIVITAHICRDYKANRDILSRVSRVHSAGTFYHTEDGQTRRINYYVESLEVGETGIIRTATISLICPDPYFTDDEATHIEMAGWEDCFEFPLEIPENGLEFGKRRKELIKVVENAGTTLIGITMTIAAEDIVVNPSIKNVTTGETLKLLCTMQPKDEIVITTKQGNIDIVLYRDGEKINYNYTVDEENEGYIQLETGRNDISYTADEGSDYMNVNFDFANSYVMP